MSIAVFGYSENPLKDRATFRVSKSTAHKWVVLGTHVPIDLKTIQAVDPTKKRIIRHTQEYRAFVPANLPPAEVGGIVVKGIKSPETQTRVIGGVPVAFKYQIPVQPSHEEVLKQYGFRVY
jgi:hypothetical protein